MDPKNVGSPVPGYIKPSDVKTKVEVTTFIPEQREDLAAHRMQDLPPAMDQISQTRYEVQKAEPSLMERTKVKAAEAADATKHSLSHAADVTKDSLSRAAVATKEKTSDAAVATKESLAHAAEVTKDSLSRAAVVTKEKTSDAAVATKDSFAHAAEVTKEYLSHAAVATKDSLSHAAEVTKEYLSQAAEATKEKVHEWTSSDKDKDTVVPVTLEVKQRNVEVGKAADYSTPTDLQYSDANRVGAAVTEFGLPAGVKTQSGPVSQKQDITRQI